MLAYIRICYFRAYGHETKITTCLRDLYYQLSAQAGSPYENANGIYRFKYHM